jgi:TPR repeat protein
MKLRNLIAGIALMSAVLSAFAGFDEGSAAYKMGDNKTAMDEWRPLAEKGDAKAQYSIGVMYFEGKGVPKNEEEAAKWQRLAAEQGFVFAQHHMGYAYEYGKGVPRDYKEAVKWYRLAAEQGFPAAQYAIGFMYNMGQGVPKNDKISYAWYSVANANGDEDAINARDLIAEKLTPAQLAEGQALATEYFEKYQPKP